MDQNDAEDFQIVAYVDVAFLCLLVYDTLLEFSQEHRHIWKSRWSVVKCLYLWTRYATYVDTSLAVLHHGHITTLPSSSCKRLGTFDTVFSGTGIGITEVILMIRTFALYGKSKKLLVFFFVMSFSLGGVNVWTVLRYARSTTIVNSCNPNNIGIKAWIGSYMCLLVGETIIVFLTLRKALLTGGLSSMRHPSKLMTTFYRDDIFFCLAFLSVFILDIVLKITIPRPVLGDVANTPLRVLHSVLACRLVIHVRHIAAEEDEIAESSNWDHPVLFDHD